MTATTVHGPGMKFGNFDFFTESRFRWCQIECNQNKYNLNLISVLQHEAKHKVIRLYGHNYN